jgi:hypothetical protein
MKSIKVTKLFSNWMGFTNQMYVLVSNILHCIENKQKILVVGDFLKEINTNDTVPITEILDFEKINNFLFNNYNITLVYYNDNNFNFVSVHYGTDTNNIDITNEFLSFAVWQDKKITFNKSIKLNEIKGDICPKIQKKVFIKYSINGREIVDEFDEYEEQLAEDIVFDFNIYERTMCSTGWGVGLKDAPKVNQDSFNFILKNIYYNQNFIKNTIEYIKGNFKLSDTINVFHIRLEDDAINHWSKLNNMEPEQYKEKLERKYINIIYTLVKKTDKNIILSWCQNNNVIKFMKENGYNVHFLPKDFSIGREVNAINDFCISKFCNNIFIGNYNPNIINNNCSTYSYYISKCLNKNVKQVLIDIENVDNECSINLL